MYVCAYSYVSVYGAEVFDKELKFQGSNKGKQGRKDERKQ